MKKLFSLLSIFAIVLSCSSDEPSTPVNPPAPIVKYTITLSGGEGGTVSTTGGEYEAGQTVSVTATPQGEYVFTSWSDGNTNATRTITIGSNSTLTANFEKRKYPLTVNFEGEGEVLEEIVNAGRTTEYNSGTTVKLTAQAAAEWVFVGWTGDIESTEESVQIVIGEPKEVTATFEKKKYPLIVNIEGEGEVIEEIIEAGRTTDYDSGTTVKLTAVPAEGWEFVGWTGAIESTELEVQLLVSEAKTLSATFNQKSPIYLDENGITIKAYDWANVGDKGIIDGVEYTIVDNDLLNLKRNENADMTKLVTTKVTSMNRLFDLVYDFNQDLGSWDTSNVVDMSYLFAFSSFDYDISMWNTSNVTNMSHMFRGAPFNHPVGNWDVSSVVTMDWMFSEAENFNQPVGEWDVSKVVNMYRLFYGTPFNQSIENWNVSNVENMASMFDGAAFNQPIGIWDVSSVKHIYYMFRNAKEFNHDISEWNITNVTLASEMFKGAESFNQDLGNLTFTNADVCRGFSSGATSWTLPKPNFPKCNPN